MKEARAIQKGTLNGRQVKFFEVWRFEDNAWVFDGKFAAPVKIADKNLVAWMEENRV